MPALRSSKARSGLVAAFAIVLVAALSLPASASRAQIDAQKAQAALAAGDKLLAAIRSANEEFPVPRLSDPAFARLYRLAFDSSLSGPLAPEPAELLVLKELQDLSSAIIQALLLDGAQGGEGELGPALAARAGENFLRYLPELGRAYDFRLLTGALIAEGAVAAKPSLPQANDRLAAAITVLADDQAAVLGSVIASCADANIDAAWRRDRLRLLNLTVAYFSALLDRKRAQNFADRALAAAIDAEDRDVAAAFKQFALALLR